MRQRHQHAWVDVSLDHIPPAEGDFNGRMSENFAVKLVAGWTVIHQRCECGDIRTQEVIGRYQPASLVPTEER